MDLLSPEGDVLVTLAERKTEIDVLDGSRNCTNNNRNNNNNNNNKNKNKNTDNNDDNNTDNDNDNDNDNGNDNNNNNNTFMECLNYNSIFKSALQ